MKRPVSLLVAHVAASYIFWALLSSYSAKVGIEMPSPPRVFGGDGVPSLLWPLLMPLYCVGAMTLLMLIADAPLWLTAAVWATYLVPLVSVYALVASAWRRLTTQPPPEGACPGCGYDMRATPGRCSECGREPISPA